MPAEERTIEFPPDPRPADARSCDEFCRAALADRSLGEASPESRARPRQRGCAAGPAITRPGFRHSDELMQADNGARPAGAASSSVRRAVDRRYRASASSPPTGISVRPASPIGSTGRYLRASGRSARCRSMIDAADWAELVRRHRRSAPAPDGAHRRDHLRRPAGSSPKVPARGRRWPGISEYLRAVSGIAPPGGRYLPISMPLTSGVGPTGAGRCSETGRRRRPARAMRWRTDWCSSAPFPTCSNR
jgi:hypothetical protein